MTDRSRNQAQEMFDPRGVVLVALGAALWGSDAVFRRGLAITLPSSTLVFFEHLILVALVIPLLPRAIRTVRQFTPADLAAATVIGIGASPPPP